jgi:hypothetical protein
MTDEQRSQRGLKILHLNLPAGALA